MFQTIFILLRRERDKVYKPLDENLVAFIIERTIIFIMSLLLLIVMAVKC